MAELNRSDVQHAVQSALHDMRNDVSRVSRMVDGMSRISQDVQDLSRRLMSLEQEVRQIQNTVANTLGRPTTRRYPDPYVVGIANEINDLKIRFSTIEKFAAQMSEYIRRRDAQDLEERQYRTA
jgi:predicted  nucleic acid-binding Zn-ribbon protein